MPLGELDQSLQDLAQILAEVPVGFCVFDRDLNYCYINPALALRNGRAAEDHLGRTMGEILQPEVTARIEPTLRQALKGGEAVLSEMVARIKSAPGE